MDLLTADARSFPADLPPADNAQAITRTDWQAFAALTRMKDHWDRPGWEDPHRRVYYWMLTFDGHTDLLDLTRRCQHPLEPLGLDLIPATGLHVTMLRIGDRHLVDLPVLRDLADTVEGLGVRAFTVHAHPIAGSRGAIRYSLSPWTPLVRLHAALTRAGRHHGVPGGADTASFRPHLGIAYNPTERDAKPVIDAASHLRQLPPMALTVPAIDLVELRREGRRYRWDTVRTIPLVTAP